MNLREEAVEAMARVYFDEVGRRSGVTLAFETAYDEEQADFKYVAGLALDGLIAYLREHRGDTVHLGPTLVPYGLEDLEFEDVLAVLEGEPDE